MKCSPPLHVAVGLNSTALGECVLRNQLRCVGRGARLHLEQEHSVGVLGQCGALRKPLAHHPHNALGIGEEPGMQAGRP